ncbi:MAG: hypothetical protein J7M19_03910 [Planctomycetes bacterium]|nr:hypothetical protein [Planctomycetota bacterium]
MIEDEDDFLSEDEFLSDERSTLKTCCVAALICLAIVSAAIALQAVTGAILAVSASRIPPPDAAAKARAVTFYCRLKSFHSLTGQLALFPAFGVMAISILFALNVGQFRTRYTHFRWAQAVKAGLLCLILAGIAFGGRLFHAKLSIAGFWLHASAEQGTAGDGITMNAFGTPRFNTFVVLHGIILPFLAVISIIFIWPAFLEFAKGEGPAARTKWTSIEENWEEESAAAEISQNSLPAGFKSISETIGRKRKRQSAELDEKE